MANPGLTFRVFLWFALTVSLALLGVGCNTDRDDPYSIFNQRKTFQKQVADAAGYAKATSGAIEQHLLNSDGTLIHIPPTTISLPKLDDYEAQRETVFQIDVFVDLPDGLADRPLHELLGNEFRVDVLGASEAEVRVAEYGSGREHTPEARISRNLVQVRVKPEDIEHSLTVVAQFPQEALGWETENREPKLIQARAKIAAALLEAEKDPGESGSDANESLRDALKQYAEVLQIRNPLRRIREVPVYNGDLITQVFMLSEEEIRDAFGSNFARHFYVGKAYFKNRHADKKLVVNTTSLRAKCLFFRPPSRSQILANYKDDLWLLDWFAWANLSESTSGEFDDLNKLLAQQIVLTRSQQAWDSLPEEQRREAAFRVVDQDLIDQLNQELETYKPTNDSIPRAQIKAYQAGVLNPSGDPSGLAKTLSEIDDPVDRIAAQTYFSARVKDYLDNPYDPTAAGAVGAAHLRVLTSITSGRLTTFPDRDLELVGPTGKQLGTSPDPSFQRILAMAGYTFEDYYRPMTFEAVLISLIKKTDQHPSNVILAWLESAGQVAGALVGIDAIVGEFGTERFAQTVAVTTGVFIPELRKRLLEDIEEFLPNLATLALGTQFTIGPNESRDGYVFFPRGAIFGFGVDEFSMDVPTWLVNIDNNNVGVDATLVERGFEFSSGVQDPNSQVTGALSSIRSQRQRRQAELADTQARLKTLLNSELRESVEELLKDGKIDEAADRVASFASTEVGRQSTDVVGELRALINAENEPGAIVLLQPEQGKGELGNTLRLRPVEAGDGQSQWEGRYRVLLCGELEQGTEALMSIKAGLPRSLKDENGELLLQLTAINGGNEGDVAAAAANRDAAPQTEGADNPGAPAVGLNFTDTEGEQWYVPREIAVTLAVPDDAAQAPDSWRHGIHLRHRMISTDGQFDSERILWVKLAE